MRPTFMVCYCFLCAPLGIPTFEGKHRLCELPVSLKFFLQAPPSRSHVTVGTPEVNFSS
ncbi:hypothetical protein, conserved [Eimeria necatrix]|uniref:Uncharacterized protein n=1 Tax=Eimeria necatrix TaxID=51315 RepID=U6N0K6_9EIME|nr:hypothetical protein, conserved [Eimeria necatrix]CDJ67475.1 hypothetical protein, conserved [Eimeria necatrix]